MGNYASDPLAGRELACTLLESDFPRPNGVVSMARSFLAFTVVLSALIAVPAAAQLSGAYTVDSTLPTGSGNYASFTDAVAALVAQGVSASRHHECVQRHRTLPRVRNRDRDHRGERDKHDHVHRRAGELARRERPGGPPTSRRSSSEPRRPPRPDRATSVSSASPFRAHRAAPRSSPRDVTTSVSRVARSSTAGPGSTSSSP